MAGSGPTRPTSWPPSGRVNRLELVGETLRAALNELAIVAPDWLRAAAPEAWYKRYAHRVEDSRIPQAAANVRSTRRAVGEDGFALLALALRRPAPEGCGSAAEGRGAAAGLGTPFVRGGRAAPRRQRAAQGQGRPAAVGGSRSSPRTAPEARFRTRSGTSWIGTSST